MQDDNMRLQNGVATRLIWFLLSSTLAFTFLALWMVDNQASIVTKILCLAMLVPSALLMFCTGYTLIKYLLKNQS